MPFEKDTTQSFIVKARLRWGERYNYHHVAYKNSRTPVEIVCVKHNYSFMQTPRAHFTAKHHCCPICYRAVAGQYQNAWRENTDEVTQEYYTLPPLINKVFRDH
ncbi:MAG: hypothetical protein HRU48_16555 [Vibrio sp.]|uniref:hypothetical protein n=1 Tax=Vibrio TaxID=662 RepID=UPI001EB90C5B|nr:hypothetical protein [Vibrio sp.]NRB68955.1 hypothetical protein [Vibrio sp.]